MKLTLGELFLLAPAALLGGILGLSILFSGPRDFLWAYEINRTNTIRVYVERGLRTAHERNNKQATTKIVNSWLASAGSNRNFASLGSSYPPTLDYWGNPYRIKQTSDLSNAECLIYSTGEDGATNSDGNDLDDIRCWDTHRGEFYSGRQNWRDIAAGIPITLISICVIFSATVWLKRSVVAMFLAKAG